MPTFDDADQEQKRPTAASGTVQAHGTQQQEPTFTPWSSFVNANKGVSDREAGKLSGGVQGDVDKAKGELANAQNTFDNGIGANYGQAPKPRPGTPLNTPVAQTTPTLQLGPEPAAPAPVVESSEPALSAFGGTGSTSTLAQAPQVRPQRVPASEAPVSYAQGDTASQAPTSAATWQSQAATATQPETSNPWASFLPGAAPAASPIASSPNVAQPATRAGLAGLSQSAFNGQTTGPADLEAAAGAPAWSQLIGNTLNASNEANALGNEAGVQALLQRNQSGPEANSAFDAALINGSGGQDFRKLSKQYGGQQLAKGVVDAEQGSQDAWKKLQGDVSGAQGLQHQTRAGTPSAGAAPAAAKAPWTPVAATETNGPISNLGQDWTAADDAAWTAALSGAGQAAEKMGGKVAVGLGPRNDGFQSNGWLQQLRERERWRAGAN